MLRSAQGHGNNAQRAKTLWHIPFQQHLLSGSRVCLEQIQCQLSGSRVWLEQIHWQPDQPARADGHCQFRMLSLTWYTMLWFMARRHLSRRYGVGSIRCAPWHQLSTALARPHLSRKYGVGSSRYGPRHQLSTVPAWALCHGFRSLMQPGRSRL